MEPKKGPIKIEKCVKQIFICDLIFFSTIHSKYLGSQTSCISFSREKLISGVGYHIVELVGGIIFFRQILHVENSCE